MINRDIIVALAGIVILTAVGLAYFNFMTHESVPGENKYRLANKYLSEGKTEDALVVFDEALSENPSYPSAYVGKAIALMELGRFDESRENFDRAIELNKKLAFAYANRGILNDRDGKYREAVRDYRTAVELDPKITSGPGLIWRFLHNVPEKPPTLADRADYIERELEKPPEERLLRVEEIDARQQMYKK